MGLVSFAIKLIAFFVVVVVAIAIIGFTIIVKHKKLSAEDNTMNELPPPNIPVKSVEPYCYPVPQQTYMPAMHPPAATTASQLQRWGDLERQQSFKNALSNEL